MADQLFQQGVDLMLYGMGTVFVFLAILVIATGGMTKFIGRFFPEVIEIPESKSVSQGSGQQSVDPKTLKIIQAAVDKHRGRK